MILLVVDAQKQITNSSLYKFDLFVENIKKLISTARKNNIEIIYIRHDDGDGSDLAKGSDGFEIFEEFSPLGSEKVFDKTVNSSFNGTGLLEYLNKKHEKSIIVIGLQTDFCIDATVKCGFEHGFEILIPQYANSTFDNQYMSAEQTYEYYNKYIWNKRYAKCLSVNEILDLMSR